ncbi:DsrH/TusB family sulfur relay protein [Thiopseudomonas denitrificans]|uniref:Sulfur relay protein TusB/DsrH n=1 Tax=Thiopseudomonas denitrificans TaxID=1501432 RepID=A0A4R6U656_9GAMM|nr:DsrH/TusB family sulfur metabolism protein [Thiopseudomonas denitrificans]TDQ40005.1 sulfur relay protein TusB/DsrH [Thiopseudomonas denitrificans]
MTTLYLVNRRDAAGQLCDLLSAGDALVLCGDAVLCWQRAWPQKVQLHVLAEDAIARNLQLPANLPAIDYPELVRLCESHARVVAW